MLAEIALKSWCPMCCENEKHLFKCCKMLNVINCLTQIAMTLFTISQASLQTVLVQLQELQKWGKFIHTNEQCKQ